MKRLFKSMAQAETCFSEKVKHLDLSNLALDAVFNGQVTWYKKNEARKIGVGALGWAKLTAPHGGIILISWGNHINTIEYLDDFLQRVGQQGHVGSDGSLYYQQAGECAREARTVAHALEEAAK